MQRTGRPLDRRDRNCSPCQGSVLVEFALISFVIYLLLAAILTFGYLLYAAQGMQTAADLAAREISRVPLPASTFDLQEVLDANANSNPELSLVRDRIFDPHYLVLENENDFQGAGSLQSLVASLPVVNQQLVPLMISDEVDGTRVLRYPGALFTDNDPTDDPSGPPPSGLLVSIPVVTSRGADDAETSIRWVPVVEEIRAEGAESSFRLSSEQRGLVALRINYPFQSAAMSGFRRNPAGPVAPSIGRPIPADDGGIAVENPAEAPGSLVASDRPFGAYSGVYGLGEQAALRSAELTESRNVRPYRRLISTQAIYRRELFGP